MNRLLSIALACVMAIPAAIAADVPTEAGVEKVSRTVTVSKPYKSISVSNAIIVNYTATSGAKNTTCTIEGNREIVDKVIVEVDDEELEIRIKSNIINLSSVGSAPVVTIQGLPVSKFETSTAAKINVNSAITTKGEYEIDASSSGIVNINANATCKDMEIDVSAGGIVNVSAKALVSGKFDADASSGGTINVMNVDCAYASVDASSGAVVNVSGSAGKGTIDASSGAVISCEGLTVKGAVTVDASSGSVVSISSAKMPQCKVEKSSGAVVKSN